MTISDALAATISGSTRGTSAPAPSTSNGPRQDWVICLNRARTATFSSVANQFTCGGVSLAVSFQSAHPFRAGNRLEQSAERQRKFFQHGQY